ncbi:MAG: transglutaminase family protein [Solirubrobacteraceae bacterium]
MLDRVLERRRGHPLLLAVVAVELARRAGVAARLYSTPARWFAGFGEPTALVELSTSRAAIPSPDLVCRRCAHEVAFGALCGLRHSYAASARRREADLAAELIQALHPHRP